MSLYLKARELARSGQRPLDIARGLGFKVFFVPFQKIKGLAISLGDNKLIMIDSGLADAEQQFVCGHELGHFLLHPSTNFLFILHNTRYYSKHEYQANRFSCELILGEKAEQYQYIISEVAAAGKLDRLVQLVWELSDKEDLIP